ncbi:hypothetical protein K2173_013070 [Erythroxylum novogranatense]|uniref:FAS1 domain-containing protein n=1 Tax=Erythroxylum novogranatense TaxID=1862640 RepID=A0AAV8S6E2_9ROSI|nr:hypothetical protein K2173_013070 [Erythroxylum novogranatense]
MASRTLTTPLLLLYFISLSSAIRDGTLLTAADILSSSGYLSMSLTLQIISKSEAPDSPSLTIFSPTDQAFVLSGQPSLSLLRFHFSPLYFSLTTLKSLSTGSKIPTLFANHSLVVTSKVYDNSDIISLNGVKIHGSPLYDDGSLVIFSVDHFIDPAFEVEGPAPAPGVLRGINGGCSVNGDNGGQYSFDEAIGALRSKGYSVLASFLELQLVGLMDRNLRITVLAPVDEALESSAGNFGKYSSIFRRHVVPCKILWRELVGFNDGAVLETYMEGFRIRVTRSGDILMLNEVPISCPNLYQNEWLVVHGLQGMLEETEKAIGK